MKRIFLYSLILSIISCSKSTSLIEEVEIETLDYFLNFDITDNVYDPTNQTNYGVISQQNMNGQLIFLDAYKSKYKYPYFSVDVSPEDSVDVIGTIHFEAEDTFGFAEKLIDFEIILRAAMVDLDQMSDSTYTFKSLETLHHQLQINNFGQKNMFGSNDRSSIFISIPNDENIINQNIYHNITTSNGFYFEDEKLELTTIDYDEQNNSINLAGNFEVQFKQLGCGFYATHLLSNAEFLIKIR